MQICAQHESVLSSHMEMLNLVRNNVPSGDALQMVSGMIEKTNRLMTQFRVVKKQLVREFFFSFFLFHFSFFIFSGGE